MQEPSQTGVRVSIQPTEGVAIPATPIYHHLPTMEGTRPGLLREEMAGPSGRVWMQGMNPVNTMSMDEYVLRMQSLVEYSQQMLAETKAVQWIDPQRSLKLEGSRIRYFRVQIKINKK